MSNGIPPSSSSSIPSPAAVKPLSQLQTMYHDTVGANAVMEMDFAIDRTGNIDPTHAARYAEFGDWIRSCYGTPVASSPWATTNSVVLDVPTTEAAAVVDRVAIQEDIAQGQRITQFTVEYQAQGTPEWSLFATGSAVGHKRIALATASVNGLITKLRLNVTGGVELPANITLAAFSKNGCV